MDDFLQMVGITKVFPHRVANENIDFSLQRGEIHAILGENGAGKTTLMNILCGLYQPQKGKIFLRGAETHINSPHEASQVGITMIHQNPMLIPTLTILENIILASRFKGVLVDKSKNEQSIREKMERYGFNLNLDTKVFELSVGQLQKVELLKALTQNPEIIIFDEATSVLTDKETDEFFDIIRALKTGGCSIIMITHKLYEVMALSDRITVLRSGKVVGVFQTEEVDKEQLTSIMMGSDKASQLNQQELPEYLIPCPAEERHPLLQLSEISANIYQGACGLKDINLSLYPEEILGIAGIDGNGQRELAEIVAGVSQAFKGNIAINGKNIKNSRPSKMIKAGVAFIPQDRYVAGAIGDLTLEENLVLPVHNRHPFSFFGLLRRKSITNFAKFCLDEYEIKTTTMDLKAKALSGGNLQKLVLARELSRNPSIIVASYPTRGLDLSARNYLWLKLKQEREKGKGILLISADLDEILALCDRVGVLYEGKLIGPLARKEITPETLGILMAGG